MMDQGETLLALARASIAQYLQQPTQAIDESAEWLQQPAATFVTLTQHHKLRGCIGSLQAHRPLIEDIKQNAIAAAFRDPRFPALAATELPITRVEVSLLSSVSPIEFSNEIDAVHQLRPNIDGVILQFQHYRGTFLPQVWESLPQPELFLHQLKRKAGLPESFWHAEVKLFRYTVEKWKEQEPNG